MRRVNRRTILATAILLCGAAAARAQTTSGLSGMVERTNLRNVRYCEILVAKQHGSSAAVYNTLGLNDCPADKWNALNANKLKKELHASMVILNGPRYLLMDRNALLHPSGLETFDGLQARLLAQLEIKQAETHAVYGKHGGPPEPIRL